MSQALKVGHNANFSSAGENPILQRCRCLVVTFGIDQTFTEPELVREFLTEIFILKDEPADVSVPLNL